MSRPAYCPDPHPHRGPHGWNRGASFERPFICPGRSEYVPPSQREESPSLAELVEQAEGMVGPAGPDLGGWPTVLAMVVVMVGLAVLVVAALGAPTT